MKKKTLELGNPIQGIEEAKVETKVSEVVIEKIVEKVEVVDPGKWKSQEWKEAYMKKQIDDGIDFSERINWDNKWRFIKDEDYKLYDVIEEGFVLKTEMKWRRQENYDMLMEAMRLWSEAVKSDRKKKEALANA